MSNNPAMVERFFHYMPSEGAAGFFFALFLVVGIVNIVQTLRWARHARYVYFVAGTAVLELIGYGARLIATQRISLGVYIAMTFFLIIPPIILAVVNYALLGRLVRAANTKIWLEPRKIAKYFLISDVVCLFLQSAGGGQMVSTDENMAHMGQLLIFVGLAVQLVFFTIFVAMSIKASRTPQLAPGTSRVPRIATVWRLIWGTMAALTIRNVFRIVEFAYVRDGTAYVTQNEWMFYVFDAVLISGCCIAYCVWHPGILLGSQEELTAVINGGAPSATAGAGGLESAILMPVGGKASAPAAASPSYGATGKPVAFVAAPVQPARNGVLALPTDDSV